MLVSLHQGQLFTHTCAMQAAKHPVGSLTTAVCLRPVLARSSLLVLPLLLQPQHVLPLHVLPPDLTHSQGPGTAPPGSHGS
jgi:hypothetical protein